MGTTRKAPSGPKHGACRHHEPYASAPAGWLCFAQASAPTDDELLDRMLWADDIEAARTAYRAAWAASLAIPATGIGIGGPVDSGQWVKAATPTAYAADLIDKRNGQNIAEPVSFADYQEEAAA